MRRSPGMFMIFVSCFIFVLILFYASSGIGGWAPPPSPHTPLRLAFIRDKGPDRHSPLCPVFWARSPRNRLFEWWIVEQKLLQKIKYFFLFRWWLVECRLRTFVFNYCVIYYFSRTHAPVPSSRVTDIPATGWSTGVTRTGFQTRLFVFGTGNVQSTLSARLVYPIDHRTHIYLFTLCTVRIIWVSVEGRNHTRGRAEFSGTRPLPHRWTFYYYWINVDDDSKNKSIASVSARGWRPFPPSTQTVVTEVSEWYF